MKHYFILLLLMAQTSILNAQINTAWQQYYEELMLIEEDMAALQEDSYEVLCDLEQNPIDINTATREDLERIPFLSQQQVEELVAYIYTYKGMQSLGELMMIASLDALRRQLLAYFITIKPIEKAPRHNWENILKYGKHRLLMTTKIPFYERKGDQKGYLGYPYTHTLRYTFSYSNFLKIGFTASQDAGEPFGGRYNRWGFDQYSYYAMVNNLGNIKTAILGHFKVRFGQGLMVNTDFTIGKLGAIINGNRIFSTFRPHASRTYYNYFQGAAATYALSKQFSLSAFVSHRPIDATITDDGYMNTIVKSGYHRTPTEIAKKHNTQQTSIGASLQWQNKGYHLGIMGLYNTFDREINPMRSKRSKTFVPQEHDNLNLSLSYGYTHHKWSLNGEIASSQMNAFAILNTFTYKLNSQLSLISLQRYYGDRYHSYFSNAMSEGGKIQNESGVLVGANWNLSKSFSLMGYTDLAFFAQPRHMVSASGQSWENFVSAVYTHRNTTWEARYRFKIHNKDNQDKTKLLSEQLHRTRLSMRYIGNKWAAQTQIDVALRHFQTLSKGYMIIEHLRWEPTKKVMLSGSIGYFNTDDYATRIYAYESSPIYSFGFSSFAGKGLRISTLLRWTFSPHIACLVKFGTTNYFDREYIGSGLQRIDGASMSDLSIQLKCNF